MNVERMDVESAHRPKPRDLLREIWVTRAWRLLPVIFLYIFSIAVLLPARPEILTNFFASRSAGRSVKCGSHGTGPPPPECQNAYSDAVWWASISDFVSHSIVVFLLAPSIGRWSDILGRRPFIALFLVVAAIPNAIFAAHIISGLSLYWYFPAQAFAGSNMLISLSTAYISDLVSVRHRAAAISLILGMFAVGFLTGPPLGGILGPVPASLVGVSAGGVSFAFLLFAVPESLSQLAKNAAAEKQRRESPWAQLPWTCLKILGRNSLFLKLAICTAIIGFATLGLLEMLAQYLQLKLDYSQMDLALIMTIAGASGFFMQTVVMRLLMRYVGETRILIIGCVSRIVEHLILCWAWDKAVVTFAVIVGAAAHLVMPAISGLVSKNAEVHEQGAALGAVYGALSLSQGFGPLAFAFLFSGFTRSDSSWPYFPGAPYLFGAFLMTMTLLVACTIDSRTAERGLEQPLIDDELTRSNSGGKHSSGQTQSAVGLANSRQPPPSYVALESRHNSSALDSAHDPPLQRRGSLDFSVRSSGSLESRLSHKRPNLGT